MTDRDTATNPLRPEDTLLQHFGATLRAYRRQRHLSQRALAKRTGINHAHISHIEMGQRNVTLLTLLRLAQALRVPAAWLLTGLDIHAPAGTSVVREVRPFTAMRDAEPPTDVPLSVQHDDHATRLRLLGATIRHHRQQQALSQQALATKTRLDDWYLSQSEQGQRNLSILSLVRIAEALGVPVSTLLAPFDITAPSSPPSE